MKKKLTNMDCPKCNNSIYLGKKYECGNCKFTISKTDMVKIQK